MRWTVVWKPIVQRDLAEMWLDAPDREAVRIAADAIDKELKVDAEQKGEDFYGDRCLVVPPLAVIFEVSPADRRVTILEVRHEVRHP